MEGLAIYAAIMALLCGLVAWIMRQARFFRALHAEQRQELGRQRVIDGLALANRFVSASSISDGEYWGIVAGCGMLVVVVSAATYRWIKHPWIASKRLPRSSGKTGVVVSA